MPKRCRTIVWQRLVNVILSAQKTSTNAALNTREVEQGDGNTGPEELRLNLPLSVLYENSAVKKSGVCC